VAYQHHERENGQGYPQGLRGNEINELAKIIGLLDSYEAMTHSRPYRKALGPSFSAKELLKTKHAAYSPNVIKAFLREISLYPVGSYVRLNNRAVAEVVETNQNHPLRPTVRILFDGEGNEVVDDVVIRLEHNPLFFIVEGLAKEEFLPAIGR
jgi:HD-GYP domain-containing protein (c-di-GMP phosphodiesterase class II)